MLLASPAGLCAQTNVGGPIVSDTTWVASGSPYVVTQSVVVGNGATLRIEAGVEVRFGAGFGLSVGDTGSGAGTLVARGTTDSPIRLTTASPPNGRWSGLRFLDLAADGQLDGAGTYVGGSILEHCRFDSSAPAQGTVDGIRCSPVLRDCEVIGGNYGFYLDGRSGSTPTPGFRVERCVFRSTPFPGILIFEGGPHLITDNQVLDCRTPLDAIWVSSQGAITLERNVIRGPGRMYVQPGAPSRIAHNVLDGAASLYVRGTAGTPSEVSDNRLERCTDWAALQVSANIRAERNVVAFNLQNGIHVGGGVGLRDNRVIGNAGRGVSSSQASNIERNVIAFNRGGGIAVAGGDVVNDNLINDNTASLGGGVLLDGRPSSFRRNTIARNRATHGGGVYATRYAWGASIAGSNGVDFTRFVGNSATRGSDIYQAASTGSHLDARYNCLAGPGSPTDPDRVWDAMDDPTLGTVAIAPTATCDPIADLGLGQPAPQRNPPQLAATGTMLTNAPLTWSVTGGRGNAAGALLIAANPGYVPFGGFVIPSLAAPTVSVAFTTDQNGAWSLTLASLPPLVPGAPFYCQAFVHDAALPFPFAFSNGLVAVRP